MKKLLLILEFLTFPKTLKALNFNLKPITQNNPF